MALSGETIDFGPCAFLDAYDPAAVFSSIDSFGRYAYANQPLAAQWNLARFAETLLPLLDENPDHAVELARAAVTQFMPRHAQHWLAGMRPKLGLQDSLPEDEALAREFLDALHRAGADFTASFRALCDAAGDPAGEDALRGLCADPHACELWLPRWRERLAREPRAPKERAAAMRRVNPAYIPRNHRVEELIEAAVVQGDFAPFRAMLRAVAEPFDPDPQFAHYSQPPREHERVLQTFCGT